MHCESMFAFPNNEDLAQIDTDFVYKCQGRAAIQIWRMTFRFFFMLMYCKQPTNNNRMGHHNNLSRPSERQGLERLYKLLQILTKTKQMLQCIL